MVVVILRSEFNKLPAPHTPLSSSSSQVVLVVKNLPANVGDTRDMGLIPGSERSPGGGNGTPLQYSCLENPMDRGAWWATVHGVIKSQTRLSMSMNVESLLMYCKISYLTVHIIFH